MQNNLNDPLGALRILESYAGPLQRWERIVDRAFVPNILVWDNDNARIVLCGGVQNAAMYGETVAGWTSYPDVRDADGFNSFAARIARNNVRPLFFREDWDTKTRVYVGHSLGGMVVQAVDWQEYKSGEDRAAMIITTGSPRALAVGFEGIYTDCQRRNFQQLGDAICQFPPRFSEAPELVLLSCGVPFPFNIAAVNDLGIEGALPAPVSLWPRFHHPGGFCWLDHSGNTVARSDVAATTFFEGTHWNALNLAVQGAAQLPAHEIALYDVNVRKWANNESEVLAKIALGEELARQGFDEEPSFILPIDFDEQHFILPLTGFYPMANNPVRTDSQPGPNGGTLGTLFLRGELVAVFPNCSKASTAARHLNRFLARLPIADEVSLSGMTAGINAYLADAAAARGVDRRPVRLGP